MSPFFDIVSKIIREMNKSPMFLKTLRQWTHLSQLSYRHYSEELGTPWDTCFSSTFRMNCSTGIRFLYRFLHRVIWTNDRLYSHCCSPYYPPLSKWDVLMGEWMQFKMSCLSQEALARVERQRFQGKVCKVSCSLYTNWNTSTLFDFSPESVLIIKRSWYQVHKI